MEVCKSCGAEIDEDNIQRECPCSTKICNECMEILYEFDIEICEDCLEKIEEKGMAGIQRDWEYWYRNRDKIINRHKEDNSDCRINIADLISKLENRGR